MTQPPLCHDAGVHHHDHASSTHLPPSIRIVLTKSNSNETQPKSTQANTIQYNTILTMKLAVLSTAAASAAAFAPSTQRATTSTSLNAEGKSEMSQALPFAPRPKLLDGTLPGDAGFDPFGFAGDDKASLVNQREAE